MDSADKILLTRTHTPPQCFESDIMSPVRPPPRPDMSPPMFKVHTNPSNTNK